MNDYILMGCVVCFCVVMIITVYRVENQIRELKKVMKLVVEINNDITKHEKEIVDKCIDATISCNKLADHCAEIIEKITK